MNSQGLNFNLTIFNCLIAVTMLELLGMFRRSHYSGISTQRGYNFSVILHFKGLTYDCKDLPKRHSPSWQTVTAHTICCTNSLVTAGALRLQASFIEFRRGCGFAPGGAKVHTSSL